MTEAMSPQSTLVRFVGRHVRRAASARGLFLVAAVGALVIGAAAVAALVFGHLTLAVALAGWASTVVLLGAVAVLVRSVRQTRRAVHALDKASASHKVKGGGSQLDRLEATQRRILAAIEQERLDNAQRHQALVTGKWETGASPASAAH